MAGNTSYPGALDTTTNLPIASALVSTELDGDGDANKVHSNLHGVLSEAAVAIEAKIGTGASTPVANRVLRGSGTGTSAWAQVALATDVSGTLPLASVATGALDSGFSITSGFGTINNGASTITTTGAVATGALTLSGALISSTDGTLDIGTDAAPFQNAYLQYLQIENTTGNATIVLNAEDGANDAQITYQSGSANKWWEGYDAGGGFFGFYNYVDGNWALLIDDATSDVITKATAKLRLDGSLSGDTYIYEESADDLHIVVGGVAMAQFDQDLHGGTGAMGFFGQAPIETVGAYWSSQTQTIGVNKPHEIMQISGEGGAITTAGSGTTSRISTLHLREPNITIGTAPVTLAATLYIGNAPTEATTNAAIYVESGAVHIDSTPANTVVSGVTASFTAGEALEDGEVVYLKAADTKVWKAVATAAATSRAMGMVVKDAAADATVQVLLQGFLRADTNFPTWTIGGALYTPEAETTGKNVPEQAAPDSTGDFVQVIGWASDANTVYFNPSNDIIEHA